MAAVHNLLEKLSRKPERFPTETIVSLAERSGKPPWSCLANPIRELGLWAAIASPGGTAGTARSRVSCVSQVLKNSKPLLPMVYCFADSSAVSRFPPYVPLTFHNSKPATLLDAPLVWCAVLPACLTSSRRSSLRRCQ